MEIYKINQISLNQTNTQFCLAYNKGIKTFRLKDYQIISSINTLGNITKAVLLYELNIVIFTGSENNDYYHNKKLVIYDNIKQAEIYTTLFKEPIQSILAENKYIFVASHKDINVFILTSLHKIQFVLQIECNPITPSILIALWTKNINSIITYYIASQNYHQKGKITIQSYYDTNFTMDKIAYLSYTYTSLQNIYYVPQFDLIFLVDGPGCNIASYSGDTLQKEQDFYRGTTKGVITSIISLSHNYVAMSNLDKTIHIFQIGKKNAKTITTLLYNIINPNMVASTMKIRLNEITKDSNNEDDHMYDSYFKQRGVLLLYSQEVNELTCLCYNGYAYRIKLNLNRQAYEIIQKVKWCNSDDDSNNHINGNDTSKESNVLNNDSVEIQNSTIDAIDTKNKGDRWKII